MPYTPSLTPGDDPARTAGDAAASAAAGRGPEPTPCAHDLEIVAVTQGDGNLTYLNPIGRRLLGIGPSDDCASRRLAELLPDWAARRVHDEGMPAARKQGSWSGASALSAAAGEELPASLLIVVPPRADGEPEIAVVVIRASPMSPLPGSTLQGTTEFLEAVVAEAPEAVFVKDLDGRYRFANPAGLALLGRPPTEVLGRTDADLFSADYAASHAAVEARIVATGATEILEAESQLGGARHVFESTKSPLRDGSGRPVGVVTIKRDVTDTRRLEARLRRAQRMEAVGRLAGSVAHDFRNVLTGIRGFAELLINSFAPEDPRAADAREILLAAERGHAITEQLLAFSRQQPQHMRPVAVDALVDGLLPLLKRICGTSIRLVRLGKSPVTVRADGSQLEQVLVNLVANARDATIEARTAGGTVSVATGVRTLPAPDTLRSGPIPSGTYATIAVRDAGVGMDQSTLDQLFEPLFTTKPAGQGTGLGLSTAYGIVTQAGGGIDVMSSPGAGSTFTVYLPTGTAEGTAE